MLDECVEKKLALLPDHAKLVVGPSWLKSIGKVPETLHVMYPGDEQQEPSTFTLMTEIFNKRWQTLDLISMMQELKRACYNKGDAYLVRRKIPFIIIKDNMSTRLRFQKTEENISVRATADIATEK